MGAFMTLLPEDYVETQCAEAVCVKGDCDNNGVADGRDVQPFTNCLVNRTTPAWACECQVVFDLCKYDLNLDCLFNIDDVPCFVDTLLGVVCGNPPPEVIEDCNSNQVPDDEDIAGQTSADANTNGVPDECEPDCNSNDVPDDWDIAQATSADCNANGSPDECEWDCNTNGVPDDCDVDPTDPDGDEFVSPDCNSNGYPDECDLAIAPGFGGSLDCNTNGIPDECDIAACESDPACDDCNENGIPDSCDIAAEISEDADTNGIPDECEGEGMMGGGGESMMSGGGEGGEESEGSQAEAWEAFYEWSAEQCWGPACESTGAEQFAATVDKLQELGLPVQWPPMGP